jgi:hypothetical protein
VSRAWNYRIATGTSVSIADANAFEMDEEQQRRQPVLSRRLA